VFERIVVTGVLGLVGRFFNSCLLVVSRRGLVLALMNAVYFGSVFVGALMAQFWFPPSYEGSLEVSGIFPVEWGLHAVVLSVFLFNLLLTAFLFTTLSGLVFFVLPMAVLVWRAVVWGFLLSGLPTPLFLIALPTFVLEGEGYVIASVAGIVLGLSWLKPKLVYIEEDLSRLEAFKRAVNEAGRIYVLVAVILFVAAVVETMTLFLF